MRTLHQDEQIDLTIEIDDDRLALRGRVVWSAQIGSREKRSGIEFVEIGEMQRQIIRTHIADQTQN